jgi:hypothetical protein
MGFHRLTDARSGRTISGVVSTGSNAPSVSCAPGQREPTPADREVPEAHRVELQEIAAGLMESISLERRASYHPPRRAGTQPVAQSFRVHFPPVARMLDEWDALVAEADAARKAVVDWATAEAQARAEAAGLTVYGPIGYIAADLVERNQTPVGFRWHEADGWLSLAGSAIVQVSPGDDPEKLRRPFDELLVDAFATDDGATLRKLRVRLDNAKAQIAEALERLKVMHVIHGQCDLCR